MVVLIVCCVEIDVICLCDVFVVFVSFSRVVVVFRVFYFFVFVCCIVSNCVVLCMYFWCSDVFWFLLILCSI